MSKTIKFVHVPMDRYYEFIKGAAESEDIVESVTYLDMKENRIYFVEKPKSHGDTILSNSCEAILSMELF